MQNWFYDLHGGAVPSSASLILVVIILSLYLLPSFINPQLFFLCFLSFVQTQPLFLLFPFAHPQPLSLILLCPSSSLSLIFFCLSSASSFSSSVYPQPIPFFPLFILRLSPLSSCFNPQPLLLSFLCLSSASLTFLPLFILRLSPLFSVSILSLFCLASFVHPQPLYLLFLCSFPASPLSSFCSSSASIVYSFAHLQSHFLIFLYPASFPYSPVYTLGLSENPFPTCIHLKPLSFDSFHLFILSQLLSSYPFIPSSVSFLSFNPTVLYSVHIFCTLYSSFWFMSSFYIHSYSIFLIISSFSTSLFFSFIPPRSLSSYPVSHILISCLLFTHLSLITFLCVIHSFIHLFVSLQTNHCRILKSSITPILHGVTVQYKLVLTN